MNMKVSKRRGAMQEALKAASAQIYAIDKAIELVKQCATAKFDESIDVAVRLGVDAKKSDQTVRGAVVMPHGTGKTAKVAVFARGEKAEIAKKAGADAVGFETLEDMVKKGEFDWNVVIATPDAMPFVGKLGQILGPRGLMPNPKLGTVTNDIEDAVKKAKAGQVQYRTDKNGIIHALVGKASFPVNQLSDNITALLQDLKRLKPAAAKGVYLKKLIISSTMGPSFVVDIASLSLK